MPIFKPMNPFCLDSQYDEYLASLIAKINKSSVLTVNDSIKDLASYLPNSNYSSDYQIILKTLKPLLSSPGKLLINKIIYFLAKKLGAECLDLIKIEWIYENFDFKDPYAQALIDKYFEFSYFSLECLKFLSWKDYLKDLQFFKFLLSKTVDANKPNGDIQLHFDVSKLPLTTYLELDLLFETLVILKNRDPINFLKFSQEGSSEKLEFIESIFNAIKAVKGTILLNRKYKILIEIFNFINDSVYEESQNLDLSILKMIVDKNSGFEINFEKLSVSTSDQLCLVVTRVSNKKEFILKNIKKSMCIFQLLERISNLGDLINKTKADETISNEILIEGQQRLKEIANESMRKHFISKLCRNHCTSEFIYEKLPIFYELLTGKNKIIAASILGKTLDPSEFEINEIDESMEFSVNVFPLNFFLNHPFKSSAIHVLKKYPELCSNGSFLKLITSFEKTTPEQIITAITDIGTLLMYFEKLHVQTIKKLCSLNTSPKLKIVYLFYLRDEAEQFNVDYSLVFEHFLEKNFLSYLLCKNNNIENFIENCVDFISNLNIENTVFYNGFNFDSDPQFYYNLKCIPERNEALNIILSALQSTNSKGSMLEVLLHLIEIILYHNIEISENLKLKLSQSIENPEEDHMDTANPNTSFVDCLKSTFNFGKNQFILERFLSEFTESVIPEISISTLEINPMKSVDVILRNLFIPKKYLTHLDPSYLSNDCLKVIMKSIFEINQNELIRPFDMNRIKDLDALELHTEQTDLIIKETDTKTVVSAILDVNDKLTSLSVEKTITEETTVAEIETCKDSADMKLELFVRKYFKEGKSATTLDFLYLIENDKILLQKNFRYERLAIYKPLILAISEEFSHSFLNLYSMTKLENSLENDDVFEMVFSAFKELKNSFWVILFSTMVKTNNLYMCFFIESMIAKYVDSSSNYNFLVQNQIASLDSYLEICTDEELSYFALSFPNLYSKHDVKRVLSIEDYLVSISTTKVDNGKLSYIKSQDFYKFKLAYRADSITHTATISIPINYPKGAKPRIEFEKDQKTVKFYHKLNELLSRTSKFIEIFFLWKIDIDNHLIGHSECLICYFIMDPKYKQLPNFTCKTCKNIFHDKCIYKWAGQSRKTSCPFCRSDLQLWDKSE